MKVGSKIMQHHACAWQSPDPWASQTWPLTKSPPQTPGCPKDVGGHGSHNNWLIVLKMEGFVAICTTHLLPSPPPHWKSEGFDPTVMLAMTVQQTHCQQFIYWGVRVGVRLSSEDGLGVNKLCKIIPFPIHVKVAFLPSLFAKLWQPLWNLFAFSPKGGQVGFIMWLLAWNTLF